MKTKKLSKKLELNKMTISSMNMKPTRGGSEGTDCSYCGTCGGEGCPSPG